MEIFVCVKRVPLLADDEIKLNNDKTDIQREGLVYALNEWDNYAIEEAIRIKELVGGKITLVTVGNKESEEIIYRGLAMGADHGVLLNGEGIIDLNILKINYILKCYIQKNKYDIILTGAMSTDCGASQGGGLLAGLMDLPYASLINKIDIVDQKTLTIAREIEGGEQEIKKISLPCVLSIQSGINEPRYVSIMAIRRAAKLTISEYKYSELDMSQEELDKIGEQTIRGNYVIPESAERAQILEGETEEIARKFVDILRDSGRL